MTLFWRAIGDLQVENSHESHSSMIFQVNAEPPVVSVKFYIICNNLLPKKPKKGKSQMDEAQLTVILQGVLPEPADERFI